jgi:hypothetical protein
MLKRSKHSLSNLQVGTMKMGNLYPIGLQELIPGDSLQHKTDSLIRSLALLAPPMHEVEIILTHAFIPNRLLWEDFEDFITGGDDGLDASVFPTIDFSSSPITKTSLGHYLGLPVGFNGSVSALPFRAYSLFWNDHIYDEELQNELVIDKSSGADTTTNTALQKVNWAKDRFTRSNANEQLGSAISIPLTGSAPVTGIGTQGDIFTTVGGTGIHETDASGDTTYSNYRATSSANNILVEEDPNNLGYPNIRADLSQASAATINELREAIALQKFAEMRQIYGSTYEKMLQADYHITPKDARLNNTEILSTGRGMLQFSEVLATAETGSSVDVGDMKGHAIAAVKSNRYRAFIQEHGYLMSFVTIRPKAIYTQGVARHWLKSTKEEFYNKHLENMGMQQITNQEVKFDHATPDGVFSHEPMYNEYRSGQPNRFFGEMTDTLDYWHFGREFASDPALNSSFIECTPTERVFAQSATDNILGMFRHSIQARRLVKKSVRPVGLI